MSQDVAMSHFENRSHEKQPVSPGNKNYHVN